MKRIFFTVTNALAYDQRMIRICTSLTQAGYEVTLVGWQFDSSIPLAKQPYKQKRLPCIFSQGKALYIEYNIRLFLFLLFRKMHCVCAIDLDTIVPCYLISILKQIPRVYDAHELFCEMKEIVTRPSIYAFWKRVERFTVPKFQLGYTVNQLIANEFHKLYRVNYSVIRNFPVLDPFVLPEKSEPYILYQGAVNHGRSFETLIPAMAHIDCKLMICGDGNFMDQAKMLVATNGLEAKVIFKGMVRPQDLRQITRMATIGVTLFENNGMSNYLSLANRFSDYIHAAIPQLCVNYPVYRELNDQYNIAVLLDELSPRNIASELNRLLHDKHLYSTLQNNCFKAREALNWQVEEKKLSSFYETIFASRG